MKWILPLKFNEKIPLNHLTSLYSGFFMLATTEEMEPFEALTRYRNRDGIEKIFQSLKTGMDCRRFRVHSYESLQAKVFIAFIDTIASK